jgi:hypothetical protein
MNIKNNHTGIGAIACHMTCSKVLFDHDIEIPIRIAEWMIWIKSPAIAYFEFCSIEG